MRTTQVSFHGKKVFQNSLKTPVQTTTKRDKLWPPGKDLIFSDPPSNLLRNFTHVFKFFSSKAYQKKTPVRWGLLDFRLVASHPPPPSLPQRAATPSVPCHTSTTQPRPLAASVPWQISYHDHRPVQLRPSAASGLLPDLNRHHRRPVFLPDLKTATIGGRCFWPALNREIELMSEHMSERMSEDMSEINYWSCCGG